MAEELRRRLEFDDNAVQLGATGKLYSLIVKKQQDDADIDLICTTTPSIPELQLLWDNCGSVSPTIRSTCCDALVNLVKHGHAEFSYVLTGLLNLVPSADNAGGIVSAVRQLLVLQLRGDVDNLEGKVDEYACPYGLRSPPHPFISILTARTDCWPYLLQEVSNVLQFHKTHGFSMLKPFLKFILLDPCQSLQYSNCRGALYNVLVDKAKQQTEWDDINNFLLDCLVCTQTDNPQSLSNAVQQVTSIHTLITAPGVDCSHLEIFICHMFALCIKLVNNGMEISPVLKVIKEVSTGREQGDIVFYMWCNLLMICPVREFTALLELGVLIWFKPIGNGKRLLVLPLLHFISIPMGPAVTMETLHKTQNQELIEQFLKASENQSGEVSEETHLDIQVTPDSSIDPWFNYMSCFTKLSRLLHNNPNTACDWLSIVQSNLSSCDRVPDLMTSFVASFLLSNDIKVAKSALDVVAGIAGQDSTQAPRLLPLLLYRLSQICQIGTEDLILPILNAIPKIATHKICVGPALRTLQSLGEGCTITPLALRLITALWQKQDRVFPHLQKLLSATHDECEPREILLAKSASIKDVCVHKPNQHGADLLPVISKILQDCSRDDESTTAALALEALTALCEAEVVDIRTTWEVLAPKLSKDTRPLVLQSLCQLFALVPSLAVETEEYEDFRCDIVESLWTYTSHADDRVCIAAFIALANFGEDEFSLDDLPDQVTAEVRAKIASTKAQNEEKKKAEASGSEKEGKEEEEEEEDIDVPGRCYVKLLQVISQGAYPGLQKLLTSLVAQELKSLPRGIHKTAMQSQNKIASQDKALSNIPNVLLTKYEKNKQPGLKAALAGGLLYCYEPKLDVGRDGRMARRHLVSRGRAYQQMMVTLVNEVTCQPTEWFRILQNPYGWTSYMERTYKALLEGREAELEMQQSHGHISGKPEEFENKLNTVWLWARDKLTDQLKSAAKGEQSVQGNSILALSGLALVSTHHALSLGQTADESQQKASEHTGQNKWLMVVVETLLSIVNGRYKPKGRIFNWCHQRTSDRGMSTASTQAQCCAILALAQLTPLIITADSAIIYHMIEVMTSGLPGQPTAAESSIIQMHHGIGLGWLLRSLYEEKFEDVAGNQGSMAMLRALDILEESALISPAAESTHGAMLGLSLALCTLANEGAAQVRAHIRSIYSKLVARLEEEKQLGSYLQAICMCVASVTSSGFHSNTISPSDAFNVAVKLQTACQQHIQAPGLAVSTGLLFHNLTQFGHPNIPPLMTNLFSTWKAALDAKGSSQQKVAALSGLTTLVMGCGTLFQTAAETNVSTDLQSKMAATLKILTQALQDGKDPGLQTTSPSLLGITFMASSSVSTSKTGIPSSYSYLADTSVLKACMDFLIEAGKLGPEGLPSERLCVVLSAMVGESDHLPALPPVNWAAVLAPLLRLPYGDDVQWLCIKLCLKQCQSQPSAVMFITSWIAQPLFMNLSEKSKELIYSSLPILIRTVPTSKLKDFMETTLIEPFTIPSVHTSLCHTVLTGLLAALKISDLPQSVPMMLYQAVETIYGYMPKQIQVCHIPLMTHVSNCLCYLPGEYIDRVSNPAGEGNLIKSMFVRSYLMSQGKQGLAWLNPCIDVGMNLASKTEIPCLLWLLMAGFRCCKTSTSSHLGAMHKMQWFMELLGHIKNIASGKVPLASNQKVCKAVDFTLHVLSGAVAMWTTSDVSLLLGLEPQCFDRDNNDLGLNGKIQLGHRDLEKIAINSSLSMLPYGLCQLLKQHPWQQMTAKILDWLLVMQDDPDAAVTAIHRKVLQACILALRQTAEFKKPAYWTRAYSR